MVLAVTMLCCGISIQTFTELQNRFGLDTLIDSLIRLLRAVLKRAEVPKG